MAASEELVSSVNSLVDDRHPISEDVWVVSLIKSAGNREHAFLLLEGIRNGVPMHLRTDYFLDINARQRTVQSLPSLVGSVVDTLWKGSEHYVGKGFVRTKSLTQDEYEVLLGTCLHQSWDITAEQAEHFLATVVNAIREGRYLYFISGYHPASSISSVSSVEAHNCVSWCQGTLKEALDIQVGNVWTPIKRPSTIVRQAIEQSAKPSTKSPEFFQDPAPKSLAASSEFSESPAPRKSRFTGTEF